MVINQKNIVDFQRAKDKILNHIDILLKHKQLIEDKLDLTIPPEIILNYKNNTFYHYGTVELHPTNVCNQSCWFCTYKLQHKNQFLSWQQARKILNLIPKAITIAGGGEPLLYNNKKQIFNDLVSLYANYRPVIELGVITNGVNWLIGNWQKFIRWIRVSLDTSNPDTYYELKETREFNRIVENIKNYIKSPVPIVGVGFLAQKKNMLEFPDFLDLCYQLDGGTQKINVQQRPVHCFMTERATLNQIDSVVRTILKKTENDIPFRRFIAYQTNFYKLVKAIEQNRSPWRERQIPKAGACFFALLYGLVNAEGEIYPCRTMAETKRNKIGNIDDPFDDLLQRKRELFETINPAECTDDCRVDRSNMSVEIALKNPSLITKASQHIFL